MEFSSGKEWLLENPHYHYRVCCWAWLWLCYLGGRGCAVVLLGASAKGLALSLDSQTADMHNHTLKNQYLLASADFSSPRKPPLRDAKLLT